jgi:hypothetical protein
MSETLSVRSLPGGWAPRNVTKAGYMVLAPYITPLGMAILARAMEHTRWMEFSFRMMIKMVMVGMGNLQFKVGFGPRWPLIYTKF